MNIKELGRRIRLLRSNLGLNQTTFAENIGITQSTLSSYEKGNATPSLDVLTSITANFHVSLDWLVGISESKFSVSSVSDIANFFFQMNDLNEVRYELEINDHLANDTETEANRWYCSLKFYGNSKGHPANQEICQILSDLEENRDSFESYFTSKDLFDLWKEQQLKYYSNSLLTKKNYPELDKETILKRRNELLEQRYGKK
ncbi:MAG: helix-turn-helix domain-containing protein [Clostridiales bacterium]|nr:helix-turn-helix domain-containing protein [Clostridiales bacterium]